MRDESGLGKEPIRTTYVLKLDPECLGRLDGWENVLMIMIVQGSNGDIAQLSYNPCTFLRRSSQGRRLGQAASATMRQWILPLLTGIHCLCTCLYERREMS
jgi:hypothetical protein